MEEVIYEVYWQGPYSEDDIAKDLEDLEDGDKSENYVLYQIYSSHPLYGKNSLLYIGKTNRSAKVRLSEHEWLSSDKYGEAKIYIASLGEFKSWDQSNNITFFEKAGDDIVSKIESILIYSHQPAYNSMNKKTAKNATNIRVFNTGEHGALRPEISSLYENISNKKPNNSN